MKIRRLSAFAGEFPPQGLKTAVAIQDELARLIEHKMLGWKVGGEFVGRILQPNLLKSPAALPEKQYGHANGIVEAELDFRGLGIHTQARRR